MDWYSGGAVENNCFSRSSRSAINVIRLLCLTKDIVTFYMEPRSKRKDIAKLLSGSFLLR